MTAKSNKPRTPKRAGVKQASGTKKLLNGGVDPSIGKATQFKPGQSGNPAGMKPGYKHINTIIQELVNDEAFEATLVDLKHGYVDYKGAPIKAIVGAIINEALAAVDPNVRKAAREQLLKYGWPTKNEVTGADGERIQLAPLVVSSIAPRDDNAPTETEAS